MSNPQSARQEWARHWPLALASMSGFMTATIFLYSLGPFIAPLESEFGWSRAQISSGFSILTATAGFLSPVVGMMIDRWGPRAVALPGAALTLASFSLVSLATDDLYLWWGIWLLMGLFAVAVQAPVWTAAIAASFDKGRGLALAVALCGSSVAATIFPLFATYVIDTYGWRYAPPIISVAMGVVILPILYFWFRSASDASRRAARDALSQAPIPPGLEAKKALLTFRFAKLAFAAFVFSVCVLGMVPNLIPVLSSMDIGRTQAATIAGTIGIASFIGRLGTGHLLDRMDSSLVSGLCVLMPLVSCVLLLAAPGNEVVAVAAVLVMGLSLGAEVDVIAFLTAKHFGTARFGTIFGVISSLYCLAAASGPLLVSLVYDITASYKLALQIAIPCFVLASAALFTLGKPQPLEAD